MAHCDADGCRSHPPHPHSSPRHGAQRMTGLDRDHPTRWKCPLSGRCAASPRRDVGCNCEAGASRLARILLHLLGSGLSAEQTFARIRPMSAFRKSGPSGPELQSDNRERPFSKPNRSSDKNDQMTATSPERTLGNGAARSNSAGESTFAAGAKSHGQFPQSGRSPRNGENQPGNDCIADQADLSL